MGKILCGENRICALCVCRGDSANILQVSSKRTHMLCVMNVYLYVSQSVFNNVVMLDSFCALELRQHGMCWLQKIWQKLKRVSKQPSLSEHIITETRQHKLGACMHTSTHESIFKHKRKGGDQRKGVASVSAKADTAKLSLSLHASSAWTCPQHISSDGAAAAAHHHGRRRPHPTLHHRSTRVFRNTLLARKKIRLGGGTY